MVDIIVVSGIDAAAETEKAHQEQIDLTEEDQIASLEEIEAEEHVHDGITHKIK